jgi:magnesium chelatase family protein
MAGLHANAHMSSREIRRFCRVTEPVELLLRRAVGRLGLSARAYHRILKIARTIADLGGAADLDVSHVGEAIQYRTLDRHGAGEGREKEKGREKERKAENGERSLPGDSPGNAV